ncbi:PAS domain-containing methyl-accepting chemotaxis protein [Leptospira sp. 96542]|nr:PAS domain-containing methyl-accepting chemotaxis protein [Leptospira sp. 96542]
MPFRRPFEYKPIYHSLNRSIAIIEFNLKGKILNANHNFLKLMGYELKEIKGKHHSLFLDEKEVGLRTYDEFWEKLKNGNFFSDRYKRFGKSKKEVWIEATYNPVLNSFGRPYKIIKLATDITDKVLDALDKDGQLDALNRSQAIISFTPDGTILGANDNFLNVFEYSIEEVRGKQHSMFVGENEKNTLEYKNFWDDLRSGIYKSDEFKRYGKNGKEIWIQSTYNPIFDSNGKVFKIVKFATDITPLVKERLKKVELQLSINHDLNQINEEVLSTSNKSAQASKASNETSIKVQSIAAGAEELSASVTEIKNLVDRSKDISEKAYTQNTETSDTIAGLSKASNKIGEIVRLINEISDQTNLLSLNASIEAARAGEAGRGFAIVASEIKKLSDQTSNATKEIGKQISAVQASTVKSVNAIREIGNTIHSFLDISFSIATAIEEQTTVTRDMAISMSSAAENVDTINSNILNISDSAEKIAKMTDKVRIQSNELTK